MRESTVQRGFAPDDAPPLDDIEAWIAESFFLLAPKRVQKLVAEA